MGGAEDARNMPINYLSFIEFITLLKYVYSEAAIEVN